MTRLQLFIRVLKPVLFIACLLPLAGLWYSGLGANPVETLTHVSGDWALRLLLLTLAITPLRRFSGWPEWLRLRRMLGLYAFFYALLHLSVYALFDHGLSLASIAEDIGKRPYVTLGFAVFLLLLPLAITSPKAMMRRLGRRWKTLHRLVYPAALLAVLHYLWLVKADVREPLIYGLVLAVLMAARLRPPNLAHTTAIRRKQLTAKAPRTPTRVTEAGGR